MSDVKLPFGKYKGKRLARVPVDYLRWCLGAFRNLDDALRRAIEAEIARRGEEPGPDESEAGPGQTAQEKPAKTEVGVASPLGMSLLASVRMIYRNLALAYYPDRGGSPDAMRALNDFHEQVQELLTRTFKEL